jgi:hypothetical protein
MIYPLIAIYQTRGQREKFGASTDRWAQDSQELRANRKA